MAAPLGPENVFGYKASYRAKMSQATTTRYWVNIVSFNHVQQGVAKGLIRPSRGDTGGFKSLSNGDCVVFYSPRTHFREGKPLQEFTALGVIDDDRLDQLQSNDTDQCRITFLPSKNVSIRGLVDDLTFLPDKEKWALPFSKGLFEISQADFERIAQAMGIPEASYSSGNA